MNGYRVKQETVPVAGAADLLIRSLLDREQFSDPHGLAEAMGISSAAWPLFGLLWPSSFELAVCMGGRPVVAGQRILELGCGLALPSLVSHRRGADVTASDKHPLAARFLLDNLRLNGLAALPYRHGDWSLPAPETELAGPVTRMEVQGRFDLLIGSDLLYERDEQGTLPQFIARHAAPGAEVLIVDPDRGNRAAFTRRMRDLGFSMSEARLDHAGVGGAAAFKGRLLSYQRKSGSGAYNRAFGS